MLREVALSTSPTFFASSCLTSILGTGWTTRRTNGFRRQARLATSATAAVDLIQFVKHYEGFVHPALRLLPASDMSGLTSSIPIAAGSLLIQLPPSLPLSLPSCHSSFSGTPDSALIKLARHAPEELWALRVALKLLMERSQRSSKWWPYISNLPLRFNLPIFFSGEDITSLQYAPVIYQVKKRCRALLDFAKVVESETGNLPLKEQPFGGQQVDANSLGWAMAAVSSRAFRLQLSEGPGELTGRDRMMLPLIDMCNHSFNPNAKIIQETKMGETVVMVVAEENIEAGMPICLSYGSLSNDALLLDYGFVVPQNPYDLVEVKYDFVLLEAASVAASVQASSFVSPTPWQQSILERLQLQGPNAILKVTIGGPNAVDERLLAAMRILYAQSPDDLSNKDLAILKGFSQLAPLGVSNENKVLRSLISFCAIILGHFPTTVAEDKNIIANEELTDYRKLAINYRLAKKQVIIESMRFLTRKLKQLGEGGS